MKELINEMLSTLQEIALRDVERIDRLPIRNIIESMYETANRMEPSAERLIFKEYIYRLERLIE